MAPVAAWRRRQKAQPKTFSPIILGVGGPALSFRGIRPSNSPSVMLFGQYLIHIGALEPQDVLAALDDQDLRVERFGRIAVKRGHLTAARLLSLLDDQCVHRRKIGETAIAFGYMTTEQVHRVLIEQKEQRRPIGVLLVDRGALDDAALRQHLANYFALVAQDQPATPLPTAGCAASATSSADVRPSRSP
jgi:hypothetical protein